MPGCSIRGCKSSSRKKDESIKFFKCPGISQNKRSPNPEKAAIMEKRYIEWCRKLEREPGSFKSENISVCSRHFLQGKPARWNELDHPDWVPSINIPGLANVKKEMLVRHQTMQKRKIIRGEIPPPKDKIKPESPKPEQDEVHSFLEFFFESYREHPTNSSYLKTIPESPLCRICLTESEPKNLIPIIEECLNKTVIEIIEFATPLVISENDGCPQNVCVTCLERVKSAYYLKRDCLEANEIFLKNCLNVQDQSPSLVILENQDNEKVTNLKIKIEESWEDPETLKIREDVQNISKVSNALSGDLTEIQSTSNHFDIPFQKEDQETKRMLEEFTQPETDYHAKCHFCDIRFYTLGQKKKHFRELHSSDEWKCCKVCGLESQNGTKNNQHYEYFHIKLCVCEVCGARFGTKSRLDKHRVANHFSLEEKEKLKTKKCPICDRGFWQTPTLKKHILTHSDNRIFECSHPNCDKKFKGSIALRRHMLSHGSEAPLHCKVCTKGFVINSELLRHEAKCTM